MCGSSSVRKPERKRDDVEDDVEDGTEDDGDEVERGRRGSSSKK
jgi:hypothetical protein